MDKVVDLFTWKGKYYTLQNQWHAIFKNGFMYIKLYCWIERINATLNVTKCPLKAIPIRISLL